MPMTRARYARNFFAKIVGDTGERVLNKVRKSIGVVTIACSIASGYDVEVQPYNTLDTSAGNAKSLRAALLIALKQWRAVEEAADE